MKAHLTRRYLFSASHRLHNEEFSAEQNRSVYGKCNNPHGHGHNYHLEITVSGQVDERTGMVCNLIDLDDFVRVHQIHIAEVVLTHHHVDHVGDATRLARYSPGRRVRATASGRS